MDATDLEEDEPIVNLNKTTTRFELIQNFVGTNYLS